MRFKYWLTIIIVFNGIIKSPIPGGDGNIEFLAHFRKEKV